MWIKMSKWLCLADFDKNKTLSNNSHRINIRINIRICVCVLIGTIYHDISWFTMIMICWLTTLLIYRIRIYQNGVLLEWSLKTDLIYSLFSSFLIHNVRTIERISYSKCDNQNHIQQQKSSWSVNLILMNFY